MSLADRLNAGEPHRASGFPCGVKLALAGLADDADRTTFTDAINRPGVGRSWHYSSRAICNALRDEGIRLSVWVIERHRRKDCRCGTI